MARVLWRFDEKTIEKEKNQFLKKFKTKKRIQGGVS